MNTINLKTIILGASYKEAPRMNNKGVSLMALIITIIVVVILAGIVLNNLLDSGTQDKALKAKILEEFIQLEDAVKLRGQIENKTAPDVYPLEGRKLSTSGGDTITIRNIVYGDGYYYLSRADANNLGVSSVMHEYVVNYSTGEVITIDPYIINDREIYTRKELVEAETGNAVTALAEYDEVKKVNKPVLFAGMIPVKRVGSEWVVTTTTDDDWYDYAGDNGPTRYANIMMYDDITLKDDDGRIINNEMVRGMNLASMVGKKVFRTGSMFIWVPRYTYKVEGGKTSIVYSKLTQDFIADGYIKVPAFYNGKYEGATPDNDNAGYAAGGKELTGFWISKYEAQYTY